MENNKQLIIRFVEELWNQRKLEIAEDIFDIDCHTFQLQSGVPIASSPRGPEIIKNHISEWLSSFPDLKFTIEQMIAEGKRINIRMMTIHRIRSGKIIEDWVIVESLGFFQQLGILSATSDLLREFRQRRE